VVVPSFTRNLLPGSFQHGDAMSMAHSLESRLPFLEYRQVDLAFSLPSDAKIAAGASKATLRSYLHRIGQHDIANRADKRGYPTPTSDWLAQGNGAILRDVLLDRSSLIGEYVDPVKLETLIDHHVAGSHRASDPVYALLTTQLWLSACIA
jgi:asparagine synthase (glutamine-hydrolysing)